jgi:hypothetical protein
LRNAPPRCKIKHVRDALATLRSKYEAIRSLRRGDPRHPEGGAVALKQQLAALATRFPGALREIDTLTLDEIDRRIEALERAEQDPSATASWMHAMTRFHALARGALFAKRHEARLRADTPKGLGPVSSDPVRVHLAERWPAEALVWQEDLARVRQPPRGRLMDLVYERLARELDTTPRKAKALIFGHSRVR